MCHIIKLGTAGMKKLTFWGVIASPFLLKMQALAGTGTVAVSCC
jgi:hypothetical protein